MPDIHIELIQSSAIEQILWKVDPTRSLPWHDGLSQLQKRILSSTAPYPPEAQQLVDTMLQNPFLTIAFVFDEKRTKVVAVPLWDVPEQVAHAAPTFPQPAHLPDFYICARNILDKPEPGEAPHVVLMTQNQDLDKRGRYPIAIARMNMGPDYLQKSKYMRLIRQIQAQLATTPGT